MLNQISIIYRLYLQKIKCNNLLRYLSSYNGKTQQDHNINTELEKLLLQHKDKIIFSSFLDREKLQLGYYKYFLKSQKEAATEKRLEYEKRKLTPLPISLKYFVPEEKLLRTEELVEVEEPPKTFQLPLESTKLIELNQKSKKEDLESEFQEKSNASEWMTNYEHFDDTLLTENEENTLQNEWKKYGTPNPSAAISRVQCGGCGALLHCNDPAIPGYLPSEIFMDRSDTELKSLECQRCHFLKEYNIALDVSVAPEEYEKLLQGIRFQKCLVLLMVDLLDFPCSIWDGLIDIVKKDKPLFIVGNKVDLLPGDSVGYLRRIKEALQNQINSTRLAEANIKYVGLISAKTGYGVEELITAMIKLWLCRGNVYLVGCTNVGKSSLFNAMLRSDYCKVQAVDIVKRATVSRWPGTTLNLLKFPINRPSGWKIYQRTRRLKAEAKKLKLEKEIRDSQLQCKAPQEVPAIIGHIGRSFADPQLFDEEEGKERLLVFDEKHELFIKSKWFYDTPGVVHPDQVLSLLTTEELLLTIPKKVLRPQCYYIYEGHSILIGGLARVDLVQSARPCCLAIFCSEYLPITVTKTIEAEIVYRSFLGTELLAVPTGGSERLKNWPGLQRHKDTLEFIGKGMKVSCGDIVLSSVGWVSVTAKGNVTCKVNAWTPLAKGIHKRSQSVLPYAFNLKGKRIRDTPAYMYGKVYSNNE